MQARRAARELALILFSQLDKKNTSYTKDNFEDIILKSVRILTNNASDELKLTIGSLIDMKEYVQNYEADHETNAERPFEVSNIPVTIPTTADMIQRIDEMTEIAEKALSALEIAEVAALVGHGNVKEYAATIAEKFQEHSVEIDEQIQKFA